MQQFVTLAIASTFEDELTLDTLSTTLVDGRLHASEVSSIAARYLQTSNHLDIIISPDGKHASTKSHSPGHVDQLKIVVIETQLFVEHA